MTELMNAENSLTAIGRYSHGASYGDLIFASASLFVKLRLKLSHTQIN